MLHDYSVVKAKKKKKVEQKMSNGKRQRIRVCLKAYDHKLIDVSAAKIVETAKRTVVIFMWVSISKSNSSFASSIWL